MARTTWPQARAFSSTALRRRIEENISSARLEELLQSQGDKPLLVDFFAEWCGPCKMLSPVLHKLVNTPSMVGGKEVDLVTIDVDNNMEAAQKYGIRAMPTVMAFKNGQLATQFVGMLPEPRLREFISSLPEIKTAVEEALRSTSAASGRKHHEK